MELFLNYPEHLQDNKRNTNKIWLKIGLLCNMKIDHIGPLLTLCSVQTWGKFFHSFIICYIVFYSAVSLFFLDR
jgi:hypothetical protein